MIDLSSTCIFSGSSENLNTTMVVTVDGEKYKVAISDEHEDDAIPSKVKELVSKKANERESKLQQLQQLAEELGIPLKSLQNAQNHNGLLLVDTPEEQQEQPVSAEPPKPRPAPTISPEEMERRGKFRVQRDQRKGPANEGLTPEEAQIALEQAAKNADDGSVESPTSREAPRFPSIQMPSKVAIRDHNGNIVEGTKPVNYAQKRQVVKGRAGIPISLPKSITSRSGDAVIETVINVVDTGGDAELQRRFKDQRYQPQCDYARECNRCRGTGFVGRAKEFCKWCSGTGIIKN